MFAQGTLAGLQQPAPAGAVHHTAAQGTWYGLTSSNWRVEDVTGRYITKSGNASAPSSMEASLARVSIQPRSATPVRRDAGGLALCEFRGAPVCV